VSAPKLVESVPVVSAPVVLPELGPRMTRGQFLAGVITGGVLLVLSLVAMVVGIAVTW
jgi:hypothetical protein